MFRFKRTLSRLLRKSLGLEGWTDPVPRRRKAVEASAAFVKLGFEALEDRILPAVTPTLSNGLLAIAFSAANDTATVSLVGSNVNVFDGTTNTTFSATAVQAICRSKATVWLTRA